MKHFLTTNPLLIGVAALIAVVYAGGRSMLGRHEGVWTEVQGTGTATIVRSADGTARADTVGRELSPLEALEGTPGVWVHGHITSAGQGYPGSVAFRSVDSEEARTTQARDDGFFELLVRENGVFEVTFEPTLEEGLALGAPSVVVMEADLPDGSEHTLELRLPEGRIEGRVVTPDDEPVSDALLSLYAGDGEGETPAGVPIAYTSTDADGSFAFALLQAGSYRVFARSRNGRQFDRETIEIAQGDAPHSIAMRWAY